MDFSRAGCTEASAWVIAKAVPDAGLLSQVSRFLNVINDQEPPSLSSRCESRTLSSWLISVMRAGPAPAWCGAAPLWRGLAGDALNVVLALFHRRMLKLGWVCGAVATCIASHESRPFGLMLSQIRFILFRSAKNSDRICGMSSESCRIWPPRPIV